MESEPSASGALSGASVHGNLGAPLLEKCCRVAEGGEEPAVACSAMVTSPFAPGTGPAAPPRAGPLAHPVLLGSCFLAAQ